MTFCFSVQYFNSRPHEEVDSLGSKSGPDRHISTHDLTKRSTDIPLTVCSILLDFNSRPHEEVDSLTSVTSFWEIPFQLTTSRRGRPFPSCLICSCFSFQLTTSRRGRRLSPGHNLLPPQFQLTTSRRGRHLYQGMSSLFRYFNSRPHEEVDRSSQFSVTR